MMYDSQYGVTMHQSKPPVKLEEDLAQRAIGSMHSDAHLDDYASNGLPAFGGPLTLLGKSFCSLQAVQHDRLHTVPVI